MEKRNIIVIGASAGGFAAIKTLITGLPADMEASIFIVWHMSPDIKGILPEAINRLNTMVAQHARHGDVVKTKQIYIAPPDHHLLLEKGFIRTTRGPKENGFRPA